MFSQITHFQSMSKIVFIFVLILIFPALGSDKEAASLNTGPDKAVLEASKEKGLKLSAEAIKTINLKLEPVHSGGPIEVPTKSVIFFQDFTGVYRVRDGWFKLIEVELGTQDVSKVSFSSKEFNNGDQIVIEGSPYLRATDMDIWGPQSDSCVD